MSDLTPEEEETVAWVMEYAIPKPSREDAIKEVLAARTELWEELSRENFATTDFDYGYGGEVVEHAATDHSALYDWIVERERRILGMTLEEFAKTDWRIE